MYVYALYAQLGGGWGALHREVYGGVTVFTVAGESMFLWLSPVHFSSIIVVSQWEHSYYPFEWGGGVVSEWLVKG